jgi:phenylalanyl-tRNA synthetase beta chain
LPDDKHVFTETVVGTRNARRLCAVYAGPTSGFEIIHGLVDRIMALSEVSPSEAYLPASARSKDDAYRISRQGWAYSIQALSAEHVESPTYFDNRAAAVMLSTPQQPVPQCIGTFGILHPQVLSAFDILNPASSMELDLEALM